MVAGAISVALLHFGIGPDTETPVGAYAVLGAWALLVFGGSFFLVMIIFDIANAVRNRPPAPKAESYRARILSAPEATRALVAFFAVRNEDSIWVMGDYSGTFAFRALGFGRLGTNNRGACLIELDPSLSVWLQQELTIVSELQVSEAAQKALIQSLEEAHSAINSLYA